MASVYTCTQQNISHFPRQGAVYLEEATDPAKVPQLQLIYWHRESSCLPVNTNEGTSLILTHPTITTRNIQTHGSKSLTHEDLTHAPHATDQQQAQGREEPTLEQHAAPHGA